MDFPMSRSDFPVDEESRLLTGIAATMRSLATGDSLEASLASAIRLLGEAAAVDRVYIFKNHQPASPTDPRTTQVYEWVASGVHPEIHNPDLQNMAFFPDFEDCYRLLKQGMPYIRTLDDCRPGERDRLAVQSIRSLAAIPVEVSHEFWGFVGFDDCHSDRKWSASTIHMLEAAAAAIGGTIERWEADRALHAANESLRHQTQELQRSRRVALSLMEDAQLAQQTVARASAAKSAFLAVMSHEMRTPLNGILGFAELLMDNPESSDVREFAATIRESGQVLLNLISDVLDFSKIESGHLKLDPVPVAPRSLVRAVLSSVTTCATTKGLELRMEIADGVPEWVIADDLRLRQILLNLLGNAVKFTDEGHVALRLKSSAIGDALHRLHFEVEDTGVGITAQALENIFAPFDQGDQSIHRRFGGSGLGLAISRRLCKLMGGDITVSSEPGVGSVFSFFVDFPSAKSGPSPVPYIGTDGIPVIAPESPLRILIVDDVATNRMLVSRLLNRMGYHPDTASSGEEAIQLSTAVPYDLILMDVLMPGIDGCEATEKIRGLPGPSGSSTACILGLSADALKENEERCLRAGMNGFLTKPIRLPEFVEAVRKASKARGGLAKTVASPGG
jgi:signal transduction histidine kinase/ActR/RegA family two-component response regulator